MNERRTLLSDDLVLERIVKDVHQRLKSGIEGWGEGSRLKEEAEGEKKEKGKDREKVSLVVLRDGFLPLLLRVTPWIKSAPSIDPSGAPPEDSVEPVCLPPSKEGREKERDSKLTHRRTLGCNLSGRRG